MQKKKKSASYQRQGEGALVVLRKRQRAMVAAGVRGNDNQEVRDSKRANSPARAVSHTCRNPGNVKSLELGRAEIDRLRSHTTNELVSLDAANVHAYCK
jgi:hypothetical protein